MKKTKSVSTVTSNKKKEREPTPETSSRSNVSSINNFQK